MWFVRLRLLNRDDRTWIYCVHENALCFECNLWSVVYTFNSGLVIKKYQIKSIQVLILFAVVMQKLFIWKFNVMQFSLIKVMLDSCLLVCVQHIVIILYLVKFLLAPIIFKRIIRNKNLSMYILYINVSLEYVHNKKCV